MPDGDADVGLPGSGWRWPSSERAVAAVAQPLLTLWNGMPVRPTRLMTASVLLDLAAAADRRSACRSQVTPGVAQRAADGLGAHVDRRLAGEPPEGMEPHPDDGDVFHVDPPPQLSPTGANAKFTSSLPSASVPNGISGELHLHADVELGRSLSVSRGLDLDDVAEVDVAHTVGLPVHAVGPRGLDVRLLRPELLGRERPQRAPPGQQDLLHLLRRAARAGGLPREGRAPHSGQREPMSCGSSPT